MELPHSNQKPHCYNNNVKFQHHIQLFGVQTTADFYVRIYMRKVKVSSSWKNIGFFCNIIFHLQDLFLHLFRSDKNSNSSWSNSDHYPCPCLLWNKSPNQKKKSDARIFITQVTVLAWILISMFFWELCLKKCVLYFNWGPDSEY